jgi:hypothetical protein
MPHLTKRQRAKKSWTDLPFDVAALILQFVDHIVEVESKRDVTKLFGRKGGIICQIYTRVAFKNAVVPFWSQSRSITFIHTQGWKLLETFQWLEKFSHLKRMSFILQNDNQVIHFHKPSKEQMQSLVEKISTNNLKELQLCMTHKSLHALSKSISKLHTLESFTLQTIRRKEELHPEHAKLIVQEMQGLNKLKYLSLDGFQVDFSFNFPSSITVLDLGLRYLPVYARSGRVLHLKSLTIRQLYKDTCFTKIAVPAIKTLTGSSLNALHVQYRRLSDVKAILDVVPTSVKVLSFDDNKRIINADFKPMQECSLDLDTLYLSGYAPDHLYIVLDAITHISSLRCLSLGRAILNRRCATALLKQPCCKR